MGVSHGRPQPCAQRYHHEVAPGSGTSMGSCWYSCRQQADAHWPAGGACSPRAPAPLASLPMARKLRRQGWGRPMAARTAPQVELAGPEMNSMPSSASCGGRQGKAGQGRAREGKHGVTCRAPPLPGSMQGTACASHAWYCLLPFLPARACTQGQMSRVATWSLCAIPAHSSTSRAWHGQPRSRGLQGPAHREQHAPHQGVVSGRAHACPRPRRCSPPTVVHHPDRLRPQLLSQEQVLKQAQAVGGPVAPHAAHAQGAERAQVRTAEHRQELPDGRHASQPDATRAPVAPV